MSARFCSSGRTVLATVLVSLSGAPAWAQQTPSGAEVWAANCGVCHRVRAVNAYDARQWGSVVTHMVLVAGLTPSERSAVRDFLVESARAREQPGDAAAAGGLATPVSFGDGALGLDACCTLAVGRAVYQAQCVACHGKKGRGDGPAAAGLKPKPPDLTDPVKAKTMSDDSLAKIIRKGGRGMPAYAKILQPDEILEVVNYLRTLRR